VILFVNVPPYENRDAGGTLLPDKIGITSKQDQPVMVRVPPEAAHAVTNQGTAPLRLIRIEYKNGFPKQS
jgi:oxalate decarboxylase/phosphoglucose isomerase-like protein (cupin superfamily)